MSASTTTISPVLRLGVLPVQGPAADHPLEGFHHVEPRATEWRVQWHHAMREQPGDDGRAQVSGEIVPDQNQAK
jgi:hypothetical protein